jgi:hypothetical protein
MRHIDKILTPKKTPPDWRQSFTPTQQQTPTVDDNDNALQSDDPQLETAPPETDTSKKNCTWRQKGSCPS